MHSCLPHTVATLPWEIQKSHYQQYYSYILQIIYIISEENKLLLPYSPHLKNVTTLPCKMHNFFIWLKVCCIPPNIVDSEKSRLWVGIGPSEKNRLWYVANGISGRQRYTKCSKWQTSSWIHAFSLYRHWSTASSSTLFWNSSRVATRRFRNSSISRIDGTWYAWKIEKDE